MTNLQRYDNSAVRAFEAFDKLTTPESFAVWCDSPVEHKPPKWIVAGQWIQYTPSGACYKITRVDKDYVYYSDDGQDILTHFRDQAPDYIPVIIKPWSFDEAIVAMNSNTRLCFNKRHSHIRGVVVHNDGTTSLLLSSCTVHSMSDLAKSGETIDHQPCGTPVPL